MRKRTWKQKRQLNQKQLLCHKNHNGEEDVQKVSEI